MAQKHRLIDSLLLQLRPSGTDLLDWLKPQISLSLLHEIAAADYGYKEQEHFQSLLLIQDHQTIPVPLRWVPREVLELMRWSEPEDPDWKPGSTGLQGHLIRAFCCAVLLKASDEEETRLYDTSENETLAQLIASVFFLGNEATESALRLVSWRLLRTQSKNEEYPFFVLALLLLQAQLFETGQNGADLQLTAEWMVREEKRAREDPTTLAASEEWLLGLTFHGQRHETWKALTRTTLLGPDKNYPSAAASVMQEICRRLALTD